MKMFYFMLATLCLLACGGGVLAAPAEAATQETKYLDGTGLPKCSRESNLHEECIKNITNTLIKRLRLGDPELNIVPYDPLLIDRLSFQYSTPIVTGRISVRNVKLFGFAEHSIEKLNVEFDGDKIKLRIKSRIPKVNIMGNYKAEMQVNQLHIKPKGNFNVTLFDVENQVVADGEIYTKDGRRFFRLTDIEANPKIGDMIIKANGIFPDPELAPQVSDDGSTAGSCSLSSSDRDECISGLFHTIVPRLKNQGLPELSMGSIDPYFYKRGIFRYTNDGIAGGLLIKNMEIYGISGLKVNSVSSNFTDSGFVIKLGVELPQLKAGGYFKADVKFGGLRLVPKGPFNITIDDVKATILTDGHIEKLPSGKQTLSLHRLNANVSVGNARVLANGIFSDRNLNAMILNLVNENLPEITRVGIPATREQWAPILVTHINEFFAPVPIEKLLVQ